MQAICKMILKNRFRQCHLLMLVKWIQISFEAWKEWQNQVYIYIYMQQISNKHAACFSCVYVYSCLNDKIYLEEKKKQINVYKFIASPLKTYTTNNLLILVFFLNKICWLTSPFITFPVNACDIHTHLTNANIYLYTKLSVYLSSMSKNNAPILNNSAYCVCSQHTFISNRILNRINSIRY